MNKVFKWFMGALLGASALVCSVSGLLNLSNAVEVKADTNVLVSVISTAHAHYFDSIRADTENRYTALGSSGYTLSNYDPRSLSFSVDLSHYDLGAGTVVNDGRMYLFRFCSSTSGAVRLYYKTRTSGDMTEEVCDFALTFSYVNSLWYVWLSSLYGSNIIYQTNEFYGALSVGTYAAATPSNRYFVSADFRSLRVTDNYLIGTFSEKDGNPWSPFYISLVGRFSATYYDTVADSGGYDAFDSGLQQGYGSGYSVGYSAGNSAGYSDGYSQGFHDGGVSVTGETVVLDVFPLAAQVLTMPVQFMMSGLDWTLFEGTRYQINLATFAGSIFIVLMGAGLVRLFMRLFH